MNAVDANVFIYAVDASDPAKSAVAMSLVDSLNGEDTILPWQVLCEFAAVLCKLRQRGSCQLDPRDAVAGLQARFPLVMPDPSVVEIGLRMHREQGVSYWDALLLAACANAGVQRLYTEDVPGRSTVLGVRVVNPFAPA